MTTKEISAVMLLISLLGAAQTFAKSSYEETLSSSADNASARKYMEQTIFSPTETVVNSPPQILTLNEIGHRVKFEVRQLDDAYYLLFLNETPIQGAGGGDRYPVAAPGNYIIKRRFSDGAFLQMKVFLQSDPGFFVRIFPDGGSVLDAEASRGGRSFLDVYLAGVCIYRNVVLPISFGQALTSSFQRIIDLASDVVDWRLFFPPKEPDNYEAVRYMANSVRKALPTLPDAEDGAMDQSGNLVFISSLVPQDQQPGFNCSGFAKWVADGLYEPVTGHYLSIATLSVKHPELRGNRWSQKVEDKRDPYFGLDWTRNIAVSLMGLEHEGEALIPTAADVKDVPFVGYVENVGYPIAELKEVLYLLAVQEPGYFYLGSVNTEFGKDPVLRQHTHVLVLFPYFTGDGTFRISVMERNVETSIESLKERYPHDFVHLVRIRASTDFVPPRINIGSH